MKHKFNMRLWLRNRAAEVAIDENLLQQSKVARVAKVLLQGSVIIHALTPVLVIVAVITLTPLMAMAQSAPGGSIFGGNDQTLGNGVREAIKWGRNLLFLVGIGGLMWAAFNYMTEKNWTKQAIGSIFCFAFGAVASLTYSFSQGNAVNLDTNLGN